MKKILTTTLFLTLLFIPHLTFAWIKFPPDGDCLHRDWFEDQEEEDLYRSRYKIWEDGEWYYSACKVFGEDKATFEALKDTAGKETMYARDKDNVFIGSYIFEGVDRNSFEVVHLPELYKQYITKDKNNVYYFYWALEGIDPNNFEVKEQDNLYLIINTGEIVYVDGVRIKGTNAESVKKINITYFRDSHHVYERKSTNSSGIYNIRVIEGSNPDYFTEGYLQAENGVYWYGKKIEGADPETFEELKCYGDYARDKNNVYFEGKITGDDAKSVTAVNSKTMYHCFDEEGALSGNIYNEKTKDLDQMKETYVEDAVQIDEALEKAEEEYEDKYPGYEPQPTPLPQIFTDVPATDENYKLTREAYDQGWLNGHPDGSLRLNDPVNRAEFAKMLMQAFSRGRGNTTELKKFPDVARTSWYGEVLARAVELKVMEGYPDGKMRPENSINRAEALKMTFETRGRGSLDYDSKEEWYEKYVKYTKKEIDRTCAEGSCEYLTFLNDGDMSKAMTRGDCIKLILRSL